jgi:hypothetical protein
VALWENTTDIELMLMQLTDELPLRFSNPCARLASSRGLQKVEVARIFRLPTHKGGKVVSPTYRLPLPLIEDP